MNDKKFQTWETIDDPSILWIKGSAGQGKTILTKFLLDHLESVTSDTSRQATVIFFFFYDQGDSLQTIGAALRSLIKQLILGSGDAFSIISEQFDIGPSPMSEDGLWAVLEAILRAPILSKIYCVVDALDECQDEESRDRLLEFLERLVHSASRRKRSSPILKVLFVAVQQLT